MYINSNDRQRCFVDALLNFYGAQYRRGKRSPCLLALLFFGIFGIFETLNIKIISSRKQKENPALSCLVLSGICFRTKVAEACSENY